MIQRIQSIWLLLASAAAFATLYFNFFYSTNPPIEFKADANNIFVLILNVTVAVLALITIFVFKTRPLQLKLSIVAIILSILSLVLCFLSVKSSLSGGLALTACFYLVLPVLLFFDERAIYKDEKLVKSTDRLR